MQHLAEGNIEKRAGLGRTWPVEVHNCRVRAASAVATETVSVPDSVHRARLATVLVPRD